MAKRIDLRKQYIEDINSWNWNAIKKETSCIFDSDNNMIINMVYIGSRIAVYPSGKIYALWTSNQRVRDVICDSIFDQLLEDIAGKHGYYPEITENNDVFLSKEVSCSSWQEFSKINFLTENDKEEAREYIKANYLF